MTVFPINAKDEINVPLALSAFRDKGSWLWSCSQSILDVVGQTMRTRSKSIFSNLMWRSRTTTGNEARSDPIRCGHGMCWVFCLNVKHQFNNTVSHPARGQSIMPGAWMRETCKTPANGLPSTVLNKTIRHTEMLLDWLFIYFYIYIFFYSRLTATSIAQGHLSCLKRVARHHTYN